MTLTVGQRVRFAPGAAIPVNNFWVFVGGLEGTVMRTSRREIWIRLDKEIPELGDWDNEAQYLLTDDQERLEADVEVI